MNKWFVNPDTGRKRLADLSHKGFDLKPTNISIDNQQQPSTQKDPIPEPHDKPEVEIIGVEPFKLNKRKRWGLYERTKRDGDHICPLCNRPLTFIDGEVDHKTPRCSAGKDKDRIEMLDRDENLWFVHKACNRLKGTKSVEEARKICRKRG